MNENEFRSRVRNALGELPTLAPPVLGPSAAKTEPAYPRAMVAFAFAVAVLFVLVLVGPRLMSRGQNYVSPGSTPKAQSTPGPDGSCHLPVTMLSLNQSGFVNLPGGEYVYDPSAGNGWATYDAPLNRWVPLSKSIAPHMSPDGRAYAYVSGGSSGTASQSASIHIVDLAGGSGDRVIWTGAGGPFIVAYIDAGVVFTLTSPAVGGPSDWLVNPQDGSSRRLATPSPVNGWLGGSGGSLWANSNGEIVRFDLQSGAVEQWLNTGQFETIKIGGGVIGFDDQHHPILQFGTRDPGVAYSVVLLDAPNHPVVIYAGRAGDATDFDPTSAVGDSRGIWFGNYDGSAIWLFRAGRLERTSISGEPSDPTFKSLIGRSVGVVMNVAGPCVPGVFVGKPATSPPPAPSPTPSPVPSPVNWSALTARPMTLAQLSPGAACPVSSRVDLQVKAQSGKWPNYGYGQGPSYVGGQTNWYSGGPQGVVILTDPKSTGPLLVRSQRLDGSGALTFSGPSVDLGTGAIGIAQTSAPPYWGAWAGSLNASAPGCYAIQFDGTNFTDVAVIAVSNSSPPPG